MLASFILCLCIFLLVGIASSFFRRNTAQDYYLASRSVSPWLVGLSAVATNNSGYMFIGVIGYTYTVGLSAGLLMLGWILGDLLASLYVHKKMRRMALQHDQSSYIGALHQWAMFGGSRFRVVAALIALVFLLAYAAAQLVAGSKALQVLLHWPAWSGAVLGAVLVMAYCLAGGIRASIWTDAAQSLVMVAAMALMLFSLVDTLGGMGAVMQGLAAIPGFLSLTSSSVILPSGGGVILFFIGWLIAGASVVAQPHIMVRFLALNSERGFVRARIWYYLWFLVFYAMATAVGMLARLYLPNVAGFDSELALPSIAMELLPPVMVGVVLAGIFAATISTADSLLLSCSSFLSQDLFPKQFASRYGAKLATLLVALCALTWALVNSQSVFALVIFSWAMLGACFLPLILLLLMRVPVSETLALLLILLGCASVLLWHFGVAGWVHNGADVYQGMPALLLCLLFAGIWRLLTNRRYSK